MAARPARGAGERARGDLWTSASCPRPQLAGGARPTWPPRCILPASAFVRHAESGWPARLLAQAARGWAVGLHGIRACFFELISKAPEPGCSVRTVRISSRWSCPSGDVPSAMCPNP